MTGYSLTAMPRTRAIASISFKNEQKKQEAIKKARQRKRSLSAQVQKYFDDLPFLE